MRKILLLVTLLSFSAGTVPAGVNTPTSISPPGGKISPVVINPASGKAFGISASRLYRSTNVPGWEDITAKITPAPYGVYALAVSPGTPALLFASVGKLIVSSDDGESWTDSSTGLPSSSGVQNITVDPTSPSILYVLTNSHAVYRSADRGLSWNATGATLTSAGTLLVDRWLSSTIFLINGSQVLRSDDSGATFNPLATPSFPSDLAVSPTQNLLVLATVNGLYHSQNYGTTWTLVNPDYRSPIAFSDAGVLFAGRQTWLESSSDSGRTFVRRDQSQQTACSTIASSGQQIIASFASGPRLSLDAGATWNDCLAGLPGMSGSNLVVDPTAPDIVYASTPAGIVRTADGGLTWSYRNHGYRNYSGVAALAIDPSSPSILLGAASQGLMHTTDSGLSWWNISTIDHTTPNAIAYDETNPTIVYIADGSGVTKSVNGGLFLVTAKNGLSGNYGRDIVVDPIVASNVYLATNAGVYKSIDSASTWSPSTTGIGNVVVTHIAIARSNHDVLYAITYEHVFRSINAGLDWNPLDASIPRPPFATTIYPQSLAVDPTNPDIAYVGFGNYNGVYGVYKTNDGGTTWSRIFDYSPALSPIAIVLRPGNPRFLYIAADTGIYTFEQVPPSAASIVPSSGDAAGGVSVIIGGTYFMSSSGVLFDTTAASVTLASTTSIAASTPSLPPGTFHDVTVMNPTLMSSTLPKAFFADYSDVPASYLLHDYVVTLTKDGVTLGCAAGLYCPNDSVLRSQMAAFIARAKAGGDANVPATGVVGSSPYNCSAGGISLFSDVAPEDVFCRHIHYIAAAGITLGCGAGQYCPMQSVSRLQMALFLARAIAGSDAAVPDSYTDPITGRSYDLPNGVYHFDDVPPSDPFSKQAHYIWALGVTDGCQATLYCPTNLTSRGQMAKFLVNAFGLH